jgi:hypothetical protein
MIKIYSPCPICATKTFSDSAALQTCRPVQSFNSVKKRKKGSKAPDEMLFTHPLPALTFPDMDLDDWVLNV